MRVIESVHYVCYPLLHCYWTFVSFILLFLLLLLLYDTVVPHIVLFWFFSYLYVIYYHFLQLEKKIAVSDEGDEENDLHSQLQLVHDFLTMFYGPITAKRFEILIFIHGLNISLSLSSFPSLSVISRHERSVMNLIDTMQTMRNNQQCILVNAIEVLFYFILFCFFSMLLK